jgi:hypothetical protein
VKVHDVGLILVTSISPSSTGPFRRYCCPFHEYVALHQSSKRPFRPYLDNSSGFVFRRFVFRHIDMCGFGIVLSGTEVRIAYERKG